MSVFFLMRSNHKHVYFCLDRKIREFAYQRGGVGERQRNMQLRFNLTVRVDELSSFDVTKDTVYVSGSGDYLGNWNLTRAVEMKLKTNLSNNPSVVDKFSNISVSSLSLSSLTSAVELTTSAEQQQLLAQVQVQNGSNTNVIEFEAIVDVASHPDVHHYKYFFAQKTSISKEKLFLKQVEYHHRKIDALNDASPNTIIHLNDTWPINDTEENANKTHLYDSGWLLHDENEFQFHFATNPIQLWNTNNEQKYLWVEILPWRASNGLYELQDYLLEHTVTQH
jgi:hypothetical protein